MNNSFLAIDFETANPKRVSACSLGAVKVVNGEIVSRQSYLIKPVGDYSKINIRIHGITPDMTANSPTFDVIFEELRHDFETLPVISYSPFDSSVFNELEKYYNLSLAHKVNFVDAYKIARDYLPGLPNYKLPTVAYHLNIPYQTHHDALFDAEQCAQIFLTLTAQYNEIKQSLTSDSNWIDSFSSLIREIVADGVVEESEAYQLQHFLETIQDKGKLFQDMADLVDDVLADGIITVQESDLLIDLLNYALDVLPTYKEDLPNIFSDQPSSRSVVNRSAAKSYSSPIQIPVDFQPVQKDIPQGYLARWAFVHANPFTTLTSANVVITEEGRTISRKDAEQVVRKLGGNLKSAISRATDFCVVLGMPPDACNTRKVMEARKLQEAGSSICILDEDEFLALAKATLLNQP